ncbi:general secretion pathway protein GspB [Alteromonas sp. 5E99-2]|uniref:general secretion pathway protein GspB n=1 Tax=Alteromonas sp. 5E99-2 TaxID=2817683 RepID=UPI001A97F03D|nr:general secretion pathway protein GspB [Alteromonas sp. 5E99-2]MBO1254177.1 general secretion pathway protein GspB [Alteromonas sp. 5E99-2]
MLKLIPIAELCPGMVITRISQQVGPVKIKKSGLVSSTDMVRGLTEMGVIEVEVDLDQTVELESAEALLPSQTQTQALLQGKYDSPGHYDSQLSDQFNRNLFLPSVQGIPSIWSVYLRQSVTFASVVLIGLGLGFVGANPQSLLFWHMGANEVAVTEPVIEQVVEPESSLVEHEPKVEPAKTDIVTTEVETQTVVQDDTQIDVDDVDANEEGVELTGVQQDEPVNVSPELLARFNKVVAEFGNNNFSVGDDATESVVEFDDIQRIDQLPVRYMTTLPSMAFTAHMYASRETDRWVRVNGQRLQEGDVISDKVQIIAIEPQRIVLSYQGEIFGMAALTDW